MSLRGQILTLEAPGGDERTNGRTNGQTRIPLVFYRTSSPSGPLTKKVYSLEVASSANWPRNPLRAFDGLEPGSRDWGYDPGAGSRAQGLEPRPGVGATAQELEPGWRQIRGDGIIPR